MSCCVNFSFCWGKWPLQIQLDKCEFPGQPDLGTLQSTGTTNLLFAVAFRYAVHRPAEAPAQYEGEPKRYSSRSILTGQSDALLAIACSDVIQFSGYIEVSPSIFFCCCTFRERSPLTNHRISSYSYSAQGIHQPVPPLKLSPFQS